MKVALEGLFSVNKPKGISSYDVIRRLKPLFAKKAKIGHGGTLDPFATGVLVIGIGKGCKELGSFLGGEKV